MSTSVQKQITISLSCLAYLWFSSLNLFAQPNEVRYERYTTENGLSSNVVYCIVQDLRGFLWIGTNEGLNRYDGYSFKTYRHDAADTNSLQSNGVHSLCVDSDGTLWIGTSGGLSKYEYSTNRIKRIQLGNNQPVWDLVSTNKDQIIF